MASTGFISFVTVTEDTSVGTVGLLSSSNLVSLISDAIIDWSTGTQSSYRYKCTAAALSALVPAGAGIDGIEIKAGSYSEDGGTDGIAFLEISLIDEAGTVRSTNKSPGTEWPTTDTSTTFGSSSDLWGEAGGFWTRDKIVHANFGVALRFQSGVGGSTTPDGQAKAIQVNIHFTAGSVEVTPTGVAGTGAAGTPTVTADANVTPTGVAGTGAAGDVTVTLNTPVDVTGVAGTGQVGDPTVTGDANVTPTGVAGTGAAGTPTVQVDVTVMLEGVSATGVAGEAAGTVSITADVAGVEAAGAAGEVAVTADANVTLTGVEATGQVGDPTITADANVPITGVEGVGQAGEVTVEIVGGTDVTVELAGVEATGAAGVLTVQAEQAIILRPKLGRRRPTTPGAMDPRPIVPAELDWNEIYKKRRARLERIADETFRPRSPEGEEQKIELQPIDFDLITHSKSNFNAHLLLLNSSLPFWC